MKETMRIVVTTNGNELRAYRADDRRAWAVWAVGSPRDILFGITEPGTSDVTVEKVEPTWPMVRIENGIAWCSHCARYACRTNTPCFKCPICGVALSGEVPQSKVADFLRQDGE